MCVWTNVTIKNARYLFQLVKRQKKNLFLLIKQSIALTLLFFLSEIYISPTIKFKFFPGTSLLRWLEFFSNWCGKETVLLLLLKLKLSKKCLHIFITLHSQCIRMSIFEEVWCIFFVYIIIILSFTTVTFRNLLYWINV